MKFSPLDSQHRALSAKMMPFGGWDMPLHYLRGTLVEHMACRQDAVMFDVSHLGTVRVQGPTAFKQLQAALTNDLNKIAPGRAQYTHLLDASDGSVLDDLIIWWIAQDIFDVMPNASNTDSVIQAIGGVDTTSTRAIIAVQGPSAKSRLAGILPEAALVGKFRIGECSWKGATCTVAGTGYTGEQGLEISVPNDQAADLWNSLLSQGIEPAGLGARDTLRLEVGLPLHGHELGSGISPLQANLEWVVSWSKGDFRGRVILEAEKRRGVKRLLMGIATQGRRPPRSGCCVHSKDGNESIVIGEVTSGNFSPVLEHGIALALLDPSTAIGDEVSIDIRGTELLGRVVPLPFVGKK